LFSPSTPTSYKRRKMTSPTPTPANELDLSSIESRLAICKKIQQRAIHLFGEDSDDAIEECPTPTTISSGPMLGGATPGGATISGSQSRDIGNAENASTSNVSTRLFVRVLIQCTIAHIVYQNFAFPVRARQWGWKQPHEQVIVGLIVIGRFTSVVPCCRILVLLAID